MQSLLTKERKAKFNINDLIFRKKFNLLSGTLLSAESLTNQSKQLYQKYIFLYHPQRNI